jgi:hypothetical protein
MDSNQERMETNIWAEIKIIREKMDSNHEKMDAWLEEMNAWQKETTACKLDIQPGLCNNHGHLNKINNILQEKCKTVFNFTISQQTVQIKLSLIQSQF